MIETVKTYFKMLKYSMNYKSMFVISIIMILVGEVLAFSYFTTDNLEYSLFLDGSYFFVYGISMFIFNGFSQLQLIKLYHSTSYKKKIELKGLPLIGFFACIIIMVNYLLLCGIACLFNPIAATRICIPLINCIAFMCIIILFQEVFYKFGIISFVLLAIICGIVCGNGMIIDLSDYTDKLISYNIVIIILAYILLSALICFLTALICKLIYRKEINSKWIAYNKAMMKK